MRTIALTVLGALVACSLLVAGQPEVEQFPAFFSRFAQDAAFRGSRIKLPLRAILGNPTDPRTKEKWSQSDLGSKLTVPIVAGELEAKNVEQSISYPSKSQAEVEQSQRETDSYIMIYRFKLVQRQWYLVEFEDSSY